MVVAYHSGAPLPGGFLGVDVFFVVSGFVIANMLLKENEKKGRIDLAGFFLRRLKRLGPNLALVLVVTSVAAFFILSPNRGVPVAADTAVGASFFVGNVVVAANTGDYFDPGSETNPLLHTWTLGVEEQFYLVFPILLIVLLWMSRRLSNRLPLLLGIGFVTIGSFSLATLGATGYTPPVIGGWFILDFYSPVPRAWEFGVGALIALRGQIAFSQPAVLRVFLLASGFFLLMWSAVFASPSAFTPGIPALAPVIGTGAIIFAGSLQPTNLVSSRLKPLIFLGNISYAWYLWHWPMIVFSHAVWTDVEWVKPLSAVFSILPAVLSYYLVEVRVRSVPLDTLRASTWLASLTVLLPAAVGLTVGLISKSVATELSLSNQAEWPGMVQNCNRLPEAAGQLTYEGFLQWVSGCHWNKELGGQPVYLIGDSNAVHFSGPVIQAAARLERPTFSFTLPDCRTLEGISGYSKVPDYNDCLIYTEMSTRWLQQEAEPGTVVFSTSDVPLYDNTFFLLDNGERIGPSTNQKIAWQEQALKRRVNGLMEVGHNVVLVQAVPSFSYPPPEWEPSLCSVFDYLNDKCRADVNLSEMSSLQDPSRNMLERVAASTGSLMVDVRDRYCSASKCSTNLGGRPAYVDATHIRSDEAEKLTPKFERALSQSLSAGSHP